MGDQEIEQLARWYTEHTLFRVELYLEFSQITKGLYLVKDEILLDPSLNDNIIDICFHVPPYLRV